MPRPPPPPRQVSQHERCVVRVTVNGPDKPGVWPSDGHKIQLTGGAGPRWSAELPLGICLYPVCGSPCVAVRPGARSALACTARTPPRLAAVKKAGLRPCPASANFLPLNLTLCGPVSQFPRPTHPPTHLLPPPTTHPIPAPQYSHGLLLTAHHGRPANQRGQGSLVCRWRLRRSMRSAPRPQARAFVLAGARVQQPLNVSRLRIAPCQLFGNLFACFFSTN